jgi:hypothetical protein
MEAWRSTCPRHTIWEDALIDRLIQVESDGSPYDFEVTLTSRGRAILEGKGHKSTSTDPLRRA